MAFPASAVTKKSAWDRMQEIAVAARNHAQLLRAQSASGPTNRSLFIRLQRVLNDAVTKWNELAAIPGLQDYARDQIDDPTLDLAAEFVAMRNAAVTLRDWIFNNIPRDAGGAVLLYTTDQSGNLVDITVGVGATAGFRTQADAFIATIE